MTDTLPEGHPVPWSELVPYEQQQGGYWVYPQGCDVYGNGRVWVSVRCPQAKEERQPRMTFVNHQQGEPMDARKDLYAFVMQGKEHSPANSEDASEKIDAYRAAILNAAAQHLYTALFPAVYDDLGQKAAEGVQRAVSELRRMADDLEAQDG